MFETKREAIDLYVKFLREKTASLFLGAGMSYEVFNIAWDELIKPMRCELGLAENKATCIEIAQYYINENHMTSDKLKEMVANKLRSFKVTETHCLLAKLPIKNYWTTNFDTLIENALNYCDKKFDLKYDNDSFAITKDTRNSILFKCHGDIDNPRSIIITKDDYDAYEKSCPNFYTALEHELCTNHILFLGYSFRDDDINSILKKVKNKNNKYLTHIFITKRERNQSEYNNQRLWIYELEKNGIKTLLIDDYSEIRIILKDIYKRYMSNKILISGCAADYAKFGSKDNAADFLHDLGYKLIEKFNEDGIKIINGNGLGVGSYLKEGISEAVADYGCDMSNHWLEYPFPKKYYSLTEKPAELEKQYGVYRRNMVDKCGVVFFVFGNKYGNGGEIVNADGVRKEFDIAVEQGKYVFPIGATGYAAEELAAEVAENYEKFNGNNPTVKNLYLQLNNSNIDTKNHNRKYFENNRNFIKSILKI